MLAASSLVPIDEETIQADQPTLTDREQALVHTIKWQTGPGIARLGNVAEIQLPPEVNFTGAEGATILQELAHNPSKGTELGLVLIPGNRAFVLFGYLESDYVRDDEKDNLDADALLEVVRENTEQDNEERQRRGWSPLSVEGWESPPHYDSSTNNLTWTIRLRSSDGSCLNNSTCLLGRRGVMSVTLVADPSQFQQAVPVAQQLVRSFSFVSGQKYAEWRAGDKVAEFGLKALIVGGTAVGISKIGVLAKWGKAIIVAVVSFIAVMFKVFFGRQTTKSSSP